MSKIARRLTGMTEKEIWEYNFPSAHNYKDVFGAENCSDVRLFAGLFFMTKDMKALRIKLRNKSILKILKKLF